MSSRALTAEKLLADVDAMNARIASSWQRVPCPRCGSPIGRRCYRLPRGFINRRPDAPALRSPHRQRWEQETPSR